MSTVQERAEADQDDADRYAQRAVRRTSQRARIAELEIEIERLQNEFHGVLCDRAEAWATITRMTLDAGTPDPTEPALELERETDAPSPRLRRAL